ncbi:MAG: hypothetical protein ACTIAG_02060 [Lactobacillus sp.]|nr:hypothetical protein [Lactobacillus sp.]MDN6043510.1 hypothetical protein [Lactobacillus sp.]MDN6052739.1 hypothetical protein [Lactobacillus sp.]
MEDPEFKKWYKNRQRHKLFLILEWFWFAVMYLFIIYSFPLFVLDFKITVCLILLLYAVEACKLSIEKFKKKH